MNELIRPSLIVSALWSVLTLLGFIVGMIMMPEEFKYILSFRILSFILFSTFIGCLLPALSYCCALKKISDQDNYFLKATLVTVGLALFYKFLFFNSGFFLGAPVQFPMNEPSLYIHHLPMIIAILIQLKIIVPISYSKN